ncbi:hypothetical protein PENSTE_c006G09933 [Penicillium steckii]|uniref:Uncharacterized protein n=1 Tax=Penicillium steckii TaxID=303698 RepID=A0A1V6TFK1_9EURO|nr:hypothetical protein PENSTE_c006G09933 [Penicillium steckii]
MSRSPANDEVDVTAEERISAMRQYQATLKSPDVSDFTKDEARDLLNNELGWDEPRREIHAPSEHHNPASMEASSRAFNPHLKKDKRAAEL